MRDGETGHDAVGCDGNEKDLRKCAETASEARTRAEPFGDAAAEPFAAHAYRSAVGKT
jgi:hypothetical protein